nr:competence protein ComEC [uncultured Neokomagataea sp.]
MQDYFEIDFLEVHTKKSGDAIGVRYRINGSTHIHVVDGGYAKTGEALVQHINEYYESPSFIDHVVVTHPDQDHAEGLQAVLENFSVGTLWMLLPWNYIDKLLPRFNRFSNPDNLKKRLRDEYPYLDKLEKIADEKGIPIREPLQGTRIGAFTVMAPSRSRYLDLVATSTRTPSSIGASFEGMVASVEDMLLDAEITADTAFGLESFIRAGWGEEKFPYSGTSNENEMSVVQFARICNKNIVLTADSGRDGLNEAADYAPLVDLVLPGGVNRFQVPHHGGRHNVSTEIMDRWFGEQLSAPPSTEGNERFTAIISAARDDEKHPRKVVVRAFAHRGAKVISTDDGNGTKRTSHNAPARDGWSAATLVPYPHEMEE